MTLRSTLYPNTGFKLNPDTIDFEKTQIGAATVSPVTIKRESCEFVIDVKDLHGGQIPSKSKDLDTNLSSQVSRAALFAATNKAGIGQGDKTVGILSPLGQMGGEGTPVKGKPLPGDNMENPQLALNNNQKDAGVEESAKGVSPGGVSASIELNSDGKWRNIRKSPANPHTQANCLRQILLLQLDLIEQQQQQLQSKDKEIDELKTEKDSLIARIERMERRLQLTKKDPRDKRLFQPLQPWTPDKDDPWDIDDLEGPQANTPARPLPFNRAGKGQKRKFCLNDPKTQKGRGKGPKFNAQKPECGAAPPFQRELRSKETPEKMGLGRSAAEKDPLHSCKEEDSEFSAQMEELPFMSTTEMYLCRWHQLPPSPLSEASPKKEEDVAIPSWRENCMEPLGEEALGDISEMLDDAIYLKRHLKLELDEKRRKRWDIQRIREQRMFQRLQQRMNKRKSVQETEPEVSSFYPDSEDVESIVITPFLPVVAFGRPLPKLTPQNFELPWLDDRSRCRIEVSKKHTPHRTCRK